MNWISITSADLKDAKVAALVNALASAALGDGQTDPTPRIIENVTLRIRAEIKGCRKNLLDADTTKIPYDLKSLATRMIVRELQSRLQISLTEDERSEARQDIRYLERIASCEVPVAIPDNPVEGEAQTSSGTPLYTTPTPYFGRTSQDGI